MKKGMISTSESRKIFSRLTFSNTNPQPLDAFQSGCIISHGTALALSSLPAVPASTAMVSGERGRAVPACFATS